MVGETADLSFGEPRIHMVANTRWLGGVAGQRLGGPLAAVEP